ncbi:MAG: LysM peptidoglycan-binding domain-containing protein, partial [Balneolaceae bacterium]
MSERITKMPRLLILLPFIILLLSVTPLFAQQSDGEHTVEAGETLFSISRIYNIPVSDLRSWNELESDQLQPGQVIRVTAPTLENGFIHRVQAGESLFAISRMYDVTIAEIQQWNQLEGTSVEADRELVIYRNEAGHTEEIPVPSISEMEQMDEEERNSIVRGVDDSSGTNSESYLVRSGDTLYQIARDHDMSVNELRQLNNLTGDMLRVGQRIMVRKVRTAPSVAEGSENSTPQGKFVLYRVQRGETMQDL